MHDGTREAVGREVLAGLIDADIIRQIAQLEARVESLKEQLEFERRTRQGDIGAVRDSVDTTRDALARLDTVVRGAQGDNGIASRVRGLESFKDREEKKAQRWDLRTWAIAMALGSGLLSLGLKLLGGP